MHSTIDILTYQSFTPSTAQYPWANSGMMNEALYLALGLNGESGEVAELVKKWYRDDTHPSPAQLEKELGDVLWYVSQLANCFNLDLATILIKNRDKLIDRQNRNKIKGSGDNR